MGEKGERWEKAEKLGERAGGARERARTPQASIAGSQRPNDPTRIPYLSFTRALAATALLAVSACGGGYGGGVAGVTERVLQFSDLSGWAADDHGAALTVFRRSCHRARATGPVWAAACREAERAALSDARAFFESRFEPRLIEDGAEPLFTGYYEPELIASRFPSARFNTPIHARPDELTADRTGGARYFSRAEIDGGALAGRGLEIFWLDDPVEAFFLQIQGSGRLRLAEGGLTRVGYAGKNGHPYRSVGAILAEAGVMARHKASAQAIKEWVRAEPVRGRGLLHQNPSYVFFRELPNLDPALGPLGALEVPLTARRSLALDQAIYPLGAPVWVETSSAEGPVRRLMIAQDVGGAIKGAQRADLFFGSGDAAGEIAGRMKYSGRMVVLVPRGASPIAASR